jgi:hypothetical protein
MSPFTLKSDLQPGARERNDQNGRAEDLLLRESAAAHTHDTTIPSSPPEELLVEVRRALAKALALTAAGREFHFCREARSNRIVAQARDLEGNVLATMPCSLAIEAITPTL